MKNIISSLIILSALVAVSCVPEPLDVDGLPEVKPQIVVSSQIIPDQSLVILLTKTLGALDASDDSDPQALLDQIAVNDAVVYLTGPNGLDSLVFLGNGVYGGVAIDFTVGESYTLHANSETLGKITASATVMPAVSFENIDADLFFNGFDDTLAQISYSFIDPAGKNYYMINVQEVERVDLVENLLNPRAFTKLIDDAGFEGQRRVETFRVVPRDYAVGDTIAVSLSNISNEYYEFIKLRQDNRFNFVQFLSEPVNYPTNVVGGKGFFNLYLPDFRVFQLDSI